MDKRMKLLAALAATIIVTGTILYLAGQNREKHMAKKTATYSANSSISLPPPRTDSSTSVEKALRERRSQRKYRQGPLALEEVAQLLWAAQGITHGIGFRTAPSAGALYPLETYLVSGDITGLSQGVYRYLPHKHELVPILPGDLRNQLCRASLNQDSICTASAAIVFSAAFARSTGKYGRRGIRYAHMEVGTAAQNVALQAVSLNLGTVAIGAFEDEAIREVLSLSTSEEPLLIMPIGR